MRCVLRQEKHLVIGHSAATAVRALHETLDLCPQICLLKQSAVTPSGKCKCTAIEPADLHKQSRTVFMDYRQK